MQFASLDGVVGHSDFESETNVGVMSGRVTWAEDRALRRAWYRLTCTGLVLALYQCPIEKAAEAQPELEECDAIAQTLEFIR
jgi:hypothetical protein